MTALYVLLERVPTALDPTLYASPALSPELQRVLRQPADRASPASVSSCMATMPGNRSSATRGGATALLGSQTMRVLAHSKIPVLVCH